MAYLSVNAQANIDGFLYLKIEDEAHLDITPALPAKHRLKVGTFKIDAHGTKLGDRFVKKLFDQAMNAEVEEVYVTIFEKHAPLIKLLGRYGFKRWGTKTGSNGTELVLVRSMSWEGASLHENYPLVKVSAGDKYLLAIYPEWHTRLLPDSKLIGEGPDVQSRCARLYRYDFRSAVERRKYRDLSTARRTVGLSAASVEMTCFFFGRVRMVVCCRKRYPTLPHDGAVRRGWGTRRQREADGVRMIGN
jgi:hypothetical protein